MREANKSRAFKRAACETKPRSLAYSERDPSDSPTVNIIIRSPQYGHAHTHGPLFNAMTENRKANRSQFLVLSRLSAVSCRRARHPEMWKFAINIKITLTCCSEDQKNSKQNHIFTLPDGQTDEQTDI